MVHLRFRLPSKAWLGLGLMLPLLQGCGAQGGWNGLFRTDLSGGAKTCVAPTAAPPDRQAVVAQMQVSNEGGWCGITTTHNGIAFESYLLTVRPDHGRIFAHRVGGATRIDYTPDKGYVGADHFTVHLIPGDSQVQGAVTVTR